MDFLISLYHFTLEKPEVVSAYAAVALLVLTVIGFYANKVISNKKVFMQKGGKSSQNIQGERVEINLRDSSWK